MFLLPVHVGIVVCQFAKTALEISDPVLDRHTDIRLLVGHLKHLLYLSLHLVEEFVSLLAEDCHLLYVHIQVFILIHGRAAVAARETAQLVSAFSKFV